MVFNKLKDTFTRRTERHKTFWWNFKKMTSWKIGIDNATLFPYCFMFTLFELFSQSIYWLLDRNLATHRINDFFGLHLNYGKLPGQQRQRISRALREDIIINSWKRKANVKIQWGFQLEYNVRSLREIRGGIDTNLSKFTLKYFYEKKEKTNTNRTWSSDGLAPPPSLPSPPSQTTTSKGLSSDYS